MSMRSVHRVVGLWLAGMAGLGCESAGQRRGPGLAPPPRQTPYTQSRLPSVPPAVAFQAALAVVGADYPVTQSSAESGLISTGWQIGQAKGGYVSDLLVPGETLARRRVTISVQPLGAGSVVRVTVNLQRDVSPEARVAQSYLQFQDTPDVTPMDRGEYGTPQQQTLWGDRGTDRLEEQRLVANIIGRSNQILQGQAGSQPADAGAPGPAPAAATPAAEPAPATAPASRPTTQEVVPYEMTQPLPM